MNKQLFDRQFKGILLCFFIYLILTIPIYLLTHDLAHATMVWNFFLAILPLLFAKQFVRYADQSSKVPAVCYAVLWLLFFPNAPYMVTDFVHISGLQYTVRTPSGSFFYSPDLLAWARVMHIGIGVLAGTLTGLLSLYLVHRLLLQRLKSAPAFAVIAASCLLSGYGVYIGRFLRLNSWDVLKPFSLLSQLIRHLGRFPIGFSILFGAYILASYAVFYVFYPKSR